MPEANEKLVFDEPARRGLGDAIVKARMSRGLSRRELSEYVQISYPYMAELEKGAKTPSAAVFESLAENLEMTPDDLMEFARTIGDGDTDLLLKLAPVGIHDAPLLPSSSNDLADRITSEVLKRLAPVIRSAVEAALAADQARP